MNWLRRWLLRVGDGSPELLHEVGRRLVAGNAKERLTRAGAVVGGAWVFWQMLGVWPWLAATVLAAWCWKAQRHADREEAEDERQAEARAELAQTLDEIYLRMVLDLIGKEQGIHLEALLPAMQSADERWEHWTRADLRALLTAIGVPVRPSLRVGVRTGVAGVHRDDARQALADYLARDPSPEEATEA